MGTQSIARGILMLSVSAASDDQGPLTPTSSRTTTASVPIASTTLTPMRASVLIATSLPPALSARLPCESTLRCREAAATSISLNYFEANSVEPNHDQRHARIDIPAVRSV